ncbi:MAG: four helix bundle protein [Clostridia bacterium]|nr:four helix bundle protein [Clostridia bacterium]
MNSLIVLSKEFAVDVINICTEIKPTKKANILINQLLKSGTSIGANIHEGNYAASRADFINKFQIALKECYETDYWLEIFSSSGMLNSEQFSFLHIKCSKIRKLLTASITTAKRNQSK